MKTEWRGRPMEKEAAEDHHTARSLAILGYHKIGPPAPGGWETWYYVLESTFARHLASLREGGWDVIASGRGRPAEVLSCRCGGDGGAPEAIRPLLERVGYRAACLYGGGPNRLPGADAYHLTRLAMGPETDLAGALEPGSK